MHNCLPFFYKPTYLITSSFSNSYSLLYFISASSAQEMQKLCGSELLGAALLSSITSWQPLEGAKPYAPRTTSPWHSEDYQSQLQPIYNTIDVWRLHGEGLALDFNPQFYSLTKTSHHCHATKALIELFLLTLIREFNQIDSHPKLQQTNLASHDCFLCKTQYPTLLFNSHPFKYTEYICRKYIDITFSHSLKWLCDITLADLSVYHYLEKFSAFLGSMLPT
jgi:hypothetical protein